MSYLNRVQEICNKPNAYLIKWGTSSKFQSITSPLANLSATTFPYNNSQRYKEASNDFAPPAEGMYLPSWTKSTSALIPFLV